MTEVYITDPAELEAEATRLASLLSDEEVLADPFRDHDAWDALLAKLGLDDRYRHLAKCPDDSGDMCLHARVANAVALRSLHLSGDHALCDHDY